MEEKVNLNVEDGEDDVYVNDVLYQRIFEFKVKKEWDYLLDNNGEFVDMSRKMKEDKFDFYVYLDKMDEKEVVDSIIEYMLNKKFVKDVFIEDFGLDEMFMYKDLRIKMEFRYKQVKENCEKRERELEMKRRVYQFKKIVQNYVKFLIMKEEKDKMIRVRQEEMVIKKEMIRIRKEMQEERKKYKEVKKSEETEKKIIILEVKFLVDQEREEELVERL